MNIIDLATKTLQLAIQTAVAGVKTVVDAIKTTVDSTKTKVDTIETRTSTISNSVSETKEVVDKIQINTNDSNYVAVGPVQSSVSTGQTDIQKLNLRPSSGYKLAVESLFILMHVTNPTTPTGMTLKIVVDGVSNIAIQKGSIFDAAMCSSGTSGNVTYLYYEVPNNLIVNDSLQVLLTNSTGAGLVSNIGYATRTIPID